MQAGGAALLDLQEQGKVKGDIIKLFLWKVDMHCSMSRAE